MHHKLGLITTNVIQVHPNQCTIRLFQTSQICTRSAYKWAYRKDLRKNTPNRIDIKNNPELWKEKQRQNSTWYEKVSPNELTRRMTRMISTTSFKLNQGGFRTGIVKVLLQIANRPNHIRIAQQALTIMQHKDMDRVWDPDMSVWIAKAAARINAPEIGLSVLRAPWLKLYPIQKSFQILLSNYASNAEKWFLNRWAEGLENMTPTSVPDAKKKGEEVKLKDPKKIINDWAFGFTETYKDLRSDRHDWKPGSACYSLVVRYYAAVGDVDTAISIFNAALTTMEMMNSARVAIILSLVFVGRTEEALQYVPNNPNHLKNDAVARALVAVHLAMGDMDKLYSLLSGHESLTLDMFKTHFGVPERVTMLKEVVERLKSVRQIDARIEEYIMTKEKEIVEPLKDKSDKVVENVEGEQEEGEDEVENVEGEQEEDETTEK